MEKVEVARLPPKATAMRASKPERGKERWRRRWVERVSDLSEGQRKEGSRANRKDPLPC
jgi:hypothetical protein